MAQPKPVVNDREALATAREMLDCICRCGHTDGDHVPDGECNYGPCQCQKFHGAAFIVHLRKRP